MLSLQVVSDLSALICLGGLIIGLGGAVVQYLLDHLLLPSLVTTHTLALLQSAFIPVYWIYMSDKLREVLRKWRRVGSCY